MYLRVEKVMRGYEREEEKKRRTIIEIDNLRRSIIPNEQIHVFNDINSRFDFHWADALCYVLIIIR